MKQLTFTVTQHAQRAVIIAAIADDDAGGSAVPAFGNEALRLALLYLEELTTAVITGKLELTNMLDRGATFEELKAKRDFDARQLDLVGGAANDGR